MQDGASVSNQGADAVWEELAKTPRLHTWCLQDECTCKRITGTGFARLLGSAAPGICHDLYPNSITLHIIEDKLGSACPLVIHSPCYCYHSILVVAAVWEILVLGNKVRQADGNIEFVGVKIGARCFGMFDCSHSSLMVEVGVQVLSLITF